MRRKSRYRPVSSGSGNTPVWPWVFAGLVATIVGWFVWQSHLPERKPQKPAQKQIKAPAPASPVTQTNIPAAVPTPFYPSTNRTPPEAIPRPTPSPPVLASPSNVYPRPAESLFEVQVALARRNVSPGSIDGTLGAQTRSALRAFQQSVGLPQTGEADPESRRALFLDEPPVKMVVVTERQLAQLRPLSRTWLGKSQQDVLAHETILEMLAEQSRSSPEVLRRLNPAVDWQNVKGGTTVRVPASTGQPAKAKAGKVRISLQRRELQAFDANGGLLAHFPCSIARQVSKRPIGELHVEVLVPDPNYTFNPERFPESPEARRIKQKLILPPGPNNPVGVAWIGLDKPGYGIHGTPSPERVGRAESHGCFRLANWNARHLLEIVWVGMPVIVEP